MALTVTAVGTNYEGARMKKTFDVTGDSSYPTGGEDLTRATLGFVNIENVTATNAGGYVFEYDRANQKLKAYWVDTTVDGAALAEVAAATNLSSVTTRIEVTGT